MAVTGKVTNRDICNDALRKIGVVAVDTDADGAYAEVARKGLRRFLKAWQNKGILLPLTASQSVTLTTAASYTLSPVRPLEVQSVRFKASGIERPMERFTREEYDALPQKTTTGTPTCFYYDRQSEAALLYVWPVLATASGETLELTYTREFEDVQMEDYIDFPAEMEEAVVYGLAARLADDYVLDVPMVRQMAFELERQALAFDREGSVYFACDEY